MNDADQIEFRRDHTRDPSSVWSRGGLIRATDQALIVALLRAVLEEQC